MLTDHQPLTTIFGPEKGVPLLAASRLQRWALFFMNYIYRIQYCSTKQFGYVDALSRLPKEFDNVFDKSRIPEEHQVNKAYAESFKSLPTSLADVANATSKDKKLELVKKYIKRGWPNKLSVAEILPYFQKRAELSVINGLILWNLRIIIPPQLRERVVEILHPHHPGVQRMKSEARQYCYWPKMDKDIENCAQNCDSCNSTQKMSRKTSLCLWPRTERLWHVYTPILLDLL